MSIIIRPAVASDSTGVLDLVEDFSVSFRPTADDFARSFIHLISQDDALLIVADEAGHVLGYLLAFDHHALFANGRVSWVEEITVQADRHSLAPIQTQTKSHNLCAEVLAPPPLIAGRPGG